jgi:hypothetical protein
VAVNDTKTQGLLDGHVSNRTVLLVVLACLALTAYFVNNVHENDRFARARPWGKISSQIGNQLQNGDRMAVYALISLLEIPEAAPAAKNAMRTYIPESTWDGFGAGREIAWLRENAEQLVFDSDTERFWTPESMRELRSPTTQLASQPTSRPSDLAQAP